MKKVNAFTLIELLIVIAIIGILASVILVSLTGGRDKARAASLIGSAESMMRAIQIDFSTTESYSNWNDGSHSSLSPNSESWVGSNDHSWAETNPDYAYNDCLTRFDSITDLKLRETAVNACNSMINNLERSEGFGRLVDLDRYKLYIGYTLDSSQSGISIMFPLPGTNKMYCFGTNGKVSAQMGTNGFGCPGSQDCPGCWGDTSL